MRVLIASLCIAVAFAGLASAAGTYPQRTIDKVIDCGEITSTDGVYTVAVKNIGETCIEPSLVAGKLVMNVCKTGALCGNVSNKSGKCVAIKRIGESCATDDECADPNYDNEDNTEACVNGKCAARLLGGEDPCEDAKQCLTSACENGKCKFAAIGAACSKNYECGHKASCEGSKCVGFLADGADCTNLSGKCNSGTCVQKKGETKTTCQSRSGVGQEFEAVVYGACTEDILYNADTKSCTAFAAGTVALDGECTDAGDCVDGAVCVCGGSGKGKCKAFSMSGDIAPAVMKTQACELEGIRNGDCGYGSDVLCEATCRNEATRQWTMHMLSFITTGDANSAAVYSVLNDNSPEFGAASGAAPSLAAAALIGAAALMWTRE